MHWKEYQEEAAAFFRRMNFEAEIEKEVSGARGVHRVDVLVRGDLYGIEFCWVIECKAWKSNIPKDKVLTLSAIVQDIGADRGFLLSEEGFQSGAIRVADQTNITLTSLAKLSELVTPELTAAIQADLLSRVRSSRERLLRLKRESERNEYDFTRLELSSELGLAEIMLQEASEGLFPILYPRKSLSFATFEELVPHIISSIDLANSWNGHN